MTQTGTQEHALAVLRAALVDGQAHPEAWEALAALTAAREQAERALRRLEYVVPNHGSTAVCPGCGAATPVYHEGELLAGGHAEDCWLNAALRSAPVACPECHGDRTIQTAPPYPGPLGHDPQAVHDETCPACGGTGDAT